MNRNAKILMAEDDSVSARYLRRMLTRLGYQVTGVVATGEEVIERVMAAPPDVILMDITLGGTTDGITAAEKVHTVSDVPVIYLTADTRSDVFERAKKTDPFAYLVKPFEVYHLQNAIELTLLKHDYEKHLSDSMNLYRTIFEVSDNAMMLIDDTSTVTMVNNQFEVMTGYSKECVELIKNWTDFFMESEQSKIETRLQHEREEDTREQGRFESFIVDTHGNIKTIYTNIRRFPDTKAFIISMNDISELKQAEQEIRILNSELNSINEGLNKEICLRQKVEKQLRFKATHDDLTGLPNRVLLFDRLKQALAFEDRHNNTLVAVMMLDLDNFKSINDSCGHLSGDILLKKTAALLRKCIRQYDTVGRLGGDEFVIILNDARTTRDIITFAEKILAGFTEPFDIIGRHMNVTASIGISVYPLHGRTIELLMKKADAAMYVAKNEGRNTYCLFSDTVSMDDSTLLKMQTRRRVLQLDDATHMNILTDKPAKPAKGSLLH